MYPCENPILSYMFYFVFYSRDLTPLGFACLFFVGRFFLKDRKDVCE
jgi:hypothetical protein